MAGEKPICKLTAFPVDLAIWKNENKDGDVWFSAKLSRRYKDGDDWKNTSSLRPQDFPLAAALLQEAFCRFGIEAKK